MSTKLKATSSKKMTADKAAKINVCWLVLGRKKVILKAACENIRKKSRKIPIVSRMSTVLRCFCSGGFGLGSLECKRLLNSSSFAGTFSTEIGAAMAMQKRFIYYKAALATASETRWLFQTFANCSGSSGQKA